MFKGLMAQAAAKAEQVQAAIADKRAALATASAPPAPGGGAPAPGGAPMTDEEELEILESAEAAAPPRVDEGMTVGGGGPGGGPGGDDGDASSWRDLFKVMNTLMESLKPAAAQVGDVSLKTVSLGMMGVARAHEGLRDEIPGSQSWDRPQVEAWVTYAKWATAFDYGRTPRDLAAELLIPAEDIAVYSPAPTLQPAPAPPLPAYFIAVEAKARAINIVVRGTTTWHDIATDLTAHTEPLLGGQAHAGMLSAARGLLARELATLARLAGEHPGFALQCIGHSLGGGVASLLAILLRSDPSYAAALPCATFAVSIGYGVPPVVTLELATACGGYVTTLVHNHDMVPRMCIANALTLYAELALAADELIAGVEARTAALAADFGERKAKLAAALTAARTKYLGASSSGSGGAGGAGRGGALASSALMAFASSRS